MTMDETDQSNMIENHRMASSSYTYDQELEEEMVEKSSSSGGDFTEERYGLFIFTVVGCVAFFIVAVLFTREFYLQKYNFDILTWTHNNSRNPNQQRSRLNSLNSLSDSSHRPGSQTNANNPQSYVETDREMAEELQRRLNDEEREAERMRKRADRREWYQSYLKPFTMVAEKKDFFYAHEMNDSPKNHVDDSEAEEEEKGVATTTTEERRDRFRTMSTGDLSEQGYDTDLELGACCNSNDADDDDDEEEPIICTEDADDAHLYVRLPVFKQHDHQQRSVDANCSICMSDYEVGDTIVWSNSECKHAFHKECIMMWLAKGKKRCPICRHWFVPGTRIEDQKKALLATASTAEAAAIATASTESSSSADTDETSGLSSSSSSSNSVVVDDDVVLEPVVFNNNAPAQTDLTQHDELDISRDGSDDVSTTDCHHNEKHAQDKTAGVAEHDDEKAIRLVSSTESSKYESSEILLADDDVELGRTTDFNNDSSNNNNTSSAAATATTTMEEAPSIYCEDSKTSNDNNEGAELV